MKHGAPARDCIGEVVQQRDALTVDNHELRGVMQRLVDEAERAAAHDRRLMAAARAARVVLARRTA